MQSRHCYLFTLEVSPLEAGKWYNELPLHCTLMHRFWSAMSSEELEMKVGDLFAATPPLVLEAERRELLEPKQVAVSLIKPTPELDALNMWLFERLNSLEVEYTEPLFVGKHHIFHVTERERSRLEIGSRHISNAVYLIEVKIPGLDHKRLVRQKIDLLPVLPTKN